MKHLLLALLLITPSAVRAEPLWAFVQVITGITEDTTFTEYVDLNSIKTFGEITYFNEKSITKIRTSSHTSVKAEQVNCPKRLFLANANLGVDNVFWQSFDRDNSYKGIQKGMAEFVCNIVDKQQP